MAASLYPGPRDPARPEQKREGKEALEHAVGEIELLSQIENVFLVYKEGWHNPEGDPEQPQREFVWTMKEAVTAFKNPRKDIVIYLEAATRPEAFRVPPVLRLAVNGVGIAVPIKGAAPFLEKVRIRAADLGTEEWVDLRLTMNGTFVPKARGSGATDDRELGLRVHSLYVGVEDTLGAVPGVVDGSRLR
jgi:hypothetical protein